MDQVCHDRSRFGKYRYRGFLLRHRSRFRKSRFRKSRLRKYRLRKYRFKQYRGTKLRIQGRTLGEWGRAARWTYRIPSEETSEEKHIFPLVDITERPEHLRLDDVSGGAWRLESLASAIQDSGLTPASVREECLKIDASARDANQVVTSVKGWTQRHFAAAHSRRSCGQDLGVHVRRIRPDRYGTGSSPWRIGERPPQPSTERPLPLGTVRNSRAEKCFERARLTAIAKDPEWCIGKPLKSMETVSEKGGGEVRGGSIPNRLGETRFHATGNGELGKQ